MPNSTAIILIDHGSKCAEAHASLENLAERIADRLGLPVFPAHLSAAQPDLTTAVSAAAAAGACRIIVCPCFLFAGQHASSDIPRLIDHVQQHSPDIDISLADPLGRNPLLADLIANHIRPLL